MSPKKLLILTSRFPYPAFGGDKLFLLNVGKALREYQLTLLCFCDNKAELECVPDDDTFATIHRVYLPKWHSYWKTLRAIPANTPLQLAYYDSPEFRKKVRELLPVHDAVLAHLIRTGQYVSEEYDKPRALLMADAISLTYHRFSNLRNAYSWRRHVYGIELRRLLEYERSCFDHFDQVWLHSAVDRAFLGTYSPNAKIVPIGVDLEEFAFRPDVCGDTVVFIGNMTSASNQDACFYFINEILPRIRQRQDIKFRIVGNCPESLKRAFESAPYVAVSGAVNKISDGLGDVFCGMCTLRTGAGLQNKILNYLALGIPCVSSQVGLEGLDAISGEHLLAYGSPEEAANQVLELHGNRNLRNSLARKGREFVERTYSWKSAYTRIVEEVAHLLENSESSSTVAPKASAACGA